MQRFLQTCHSQAWLSEHLQHNSTCAFSHSRSDHINKGIINQARPVSGEMVGLSSNAAHAVHLSSCCMQTGAQISTLRRASAS